MSTSGECFLGCFFFLMWSFGDTFVPFVIPTILHHRQTPAHVQVVGCGERRASLEELGGHK